jgi:hypothetical protein
MLKIHDVQKALPGSGEYIVGADQTGSHACYLIYGKMDPSEEGRKLKAGKGHEEIFLAVQGSFLLTPHSSGSATEEVVEIKEGQAFHLVGEHTYFLKNATDSSACYVMAGGHTSHGHHEHH